MTSTVSEDLRKSLIFQFTKAKISGDLVTASELLGLLWPEVKTIPGDKK